MSSLKITHEDFLAAEAFERDYREIKVDDGDFPTIAAVYILGMQSERIKHEDLPGELKDLRAVVLRLERALIEVLVEKTEASKREAQKALWDARATMDAWSKLTKDKK